MKVWYVLGSISAYCADVAVKTQTQGHETILDSLRFHMTNSWASILSSGGGTSGFLSFPCLPHRRGSFFWNQFAGKRESQVNRSHPFNQAFTLSTSIKCCIHPLSLLPPLSDLFEGCRATLKQWCSSSTILAAGILTELIWAGVLCHVGWAWLEGPRRCYLSGMGALCFPGSLSLSRAAM